MPVLDKKPCYRRTVFKGGAPVLKLNKICKEGDFFQKNLIRTFKKPIYINGTESCLDVSRTQ